MRCVSSVLGASLLLSLAAVAFGQQRDSATFTRASVSRAPVAKRATAAEQRRAAEKLRRRLDFIDANTLNATSARLSRLSAIGQTVLTSGDEQTTYLLVRRTTSSAPEVHARWDDLVLVRSGTGAIEMGDSLTGSSYRGPGERAGGRFAKSYRIVVHAGDLVRIPAAVPHAFIVSGTEPLEYLVIKNRRQELPVRWYGDP